MPAYSVRLRLTKYLFRECVFIKNAFPGQRVDVFCKAGDEDLVDSESEFWMCCQLGNFNVTDCKFGFSLSEHHRMFTINFRGRGVDRGAVNLGRGDGSGVDFVVYVRR